MKTIKTSLVLIVAFLMFGSINGYSQKKGGKGEGHSKGKSHGNPKKVMVVKQ